MIVKDENNDVKMKVVQSDNDEKQGNKRGITFIKKYCLSYITK